MKAVLRLGVAVLLAGLSLGAAPAAAQDAGAATTNTPATDSIGPRELQNFSIEGTVTRPAEQQPAARQPAPARSASAASPPSSSADAPVRRTAEIATPAATGRDRELAQRTPSRATETRAAPSVAMNLPQVSDEPSSAATADATPAAAAGFADASAEPASLAPQHQMSFLPWLLAAMFLGAGGAFLFWRNRHREAFAGGPQLDAFAAPEALAPRPRPPVPAPPPQRPPSAVPGLVSTRLRPWVDYEFHPLRCVVDDHQVTMEFELELFNSGSAPARAVLVEATLFNAGPNQDREIQSFYAHPVGDGERIVAIQPLKRMTLRTKVAIPRDQVQVLDAAGRKVFVPLIAFNALYRWSGGEGQSSISYLIGRDNKGEKLAPFRIDLGPRVFRGLAARALPLGVRQ